MLLVGRQLKVCQYNNANPLPFSAWKYTAKATTLQTHNTEKSHILYSPTEVWYS